MPTTPRLVAQEALPYTIVVVGDYVSLDGRYYLAIPTRRRGFCDGCHFRTTMLRCPSNCTYLVYKECSEEEAFRMTGERRVNLANRKPTKGLALPLPK